MNSAATFSQKSETNQTDMVGELAKATQIHVTTKKKQQRNKQENHHRSDSFSRANNEVRRKAGGEMYNL